MTPSRVFAESMYDVIHSMFNLGSEEDERYDGHRPTPTEYYQTLRKSMIGSLLEIHIVKYTWLNETHMVFEDVWVYRNKENRNHLTLVEPGFSVKELRFQDYRRAQTYTKKHIHFHFPRQPYVPRHKVKAS